MSKFLYLIVFIPFLLFVMLAFYHIHLMYKESKIKYVKKEIKQKFKIIDGGKK